MPWACHGGGRGQGSALPLRALVWACQGGGEAALLGVTASDSSGSGHFLHRPSPGRGQRTALCLEMVHHLVHDLAKLGVKPDWVVTVDAGDQVRALSQVGLVLIAPLYPLMILIAYLHRFTKSIARRTCFS